MTERKKAAGCRAAWDYVPLLENGFVLLLPLVFEVRGELMPDAEERVGWDLLLSSLGLHWEEHCELHEPDKTQSQVDTWTLFSIWSQKWATVCRLWCKDQKTCSHDCVWKNMGVMSMMSQWYLRVPFKTKKLKKYECMLAAIITYSNRVRNKSLTVFNTSL